MADPVVSCPKVTEHAAFVQAQTPAAKETKDAQHVLAYCPDCTAWYLIVNGGAMHGTVSYRALLARIEPLPTEVEQLVDEAFSKMSPIYRP